MPATSEFENRPWRSRAARFAPAVLALYWVAIFTATHIPRIPQPNLFSWEDKVVHFGLYFVLAAMINATRRLKGQLSAPHYVQTVAILAAYGAFDELSQTPVGRTCSIYDWYADLLGAICGAIAIAVIVRWRVAARARPTLLTDPQPAFRARDLTA